MSAKLDAAALRAVIERDRTLFAETVTNMRRRLQSVWWMTDGRGPYEWDDARYQKEFGDAIELIRADLEPLEKRAADMTDSPKTDAEIKAARNAIAERDRLLGRVAELEKARVEAIAILAELECDDAPDAFECAARARVALCKAKAGEP